jgi:hypothetical protein
MALASDEDHETAIVIGTRATDNEEVVKVSEENKYFSI